MGDKHVTVNFVQDTSKFWYKPEISREQGMFFKCLARHTASFFVFGDEYLSLTVPFQLYSNLCLCFARYYSPFQNPNSLNLSCLLKGDPCQLLVFAVIPN